MSCMWYHFLYFCLSSSSSLKYFSFSFALYNRNIWQKLNHITYSLDVTHARSSSISPPNKQTHTRALTDHPFPVEPLGRATVRVAMVTKYSSNDELSCNTTSWGKFITCLCMCVFVSWLWAQVHPRDMCTLPLLYAPHTNDGPFSAPSVKALKIADDTTLASMRDGSPGCHRRVQTNKLELNVQKTIEIQVSHFQTLAYSSHPGYCWQQGGSVIRETSLKQGDLFFSPVFWPEWRWGAEGLYADQ